MWREVIELANLVETVVYGEVVKDATYRKVYANKKSVRQSEFYQGASAGLKPELVFEIRSIEFGDEEYIRFNGNMYTIMRTYENGENIELTVTTFAGVDVDG